jgi:hypothetical protein
MVFRNRAARVCGTNIGRRFSERPARHVRAMTATFKDAQAHSRARADQRLLRKHSGAGAISGNDCRCQKPAALG